MNARLMVMTISALGFMSIPVFAEDAAPVKAPGHHEMKMFEKADTNGDGMISKDEWMAFSMKEFATLDKNGDGNITKDEIKAHEEEEENEEKGKKEDKDDNTEKAGH